MFASCNTAAATIVLSVYLFVPEATSLSCYECTESDGQHCKDPFEASRVTVTDCDRSIYTVDQMRMTTKHFACLLLVESDITSNLKTFTRRCSISNSNDTCANIEAKNKMAGNVATTCFQCERDLCNSSGGFGPSALHLAAFLLFIYCYF
ncbi:uncharacterized protein LOC132706327 [Cylas formicarius]|uniref:uncharacterized protein LOC132706327 n=1 Tax=Cylas formicarius TaxID=197179 RepID=UPI0029585329|nr:uncharacterized protein LOC132706327 [Cylas formicarius]